MQRIWLAVLSLLILSSFSINAHAHSSPSRADVFCTAQETPRIGIVVTDANGLGCYGVPVSVSVTTGAGIPSTTSTTTDANGMVYVSIAGSAYGDTLNVYCNAVVTGISNSVVVSTARPVVNTDSVIAWFGESTHTFYSAVVDSSTKALVTVVSGSIDADDIDNNGDADTKRLTFAETIMQDATDSPYMRRVFPGTYDTNNSIRVNVDEISGDPDATVSLATLSYTRLLHTYATGGANPKVVAVMTDLNGVAVSGVTITASSTAGSMTPGSGMTNDNGVIEFQQSGGALGNTITVSSNLTANLPIDIITSASGVMSSTDKVFSWFEPKTRMIYTAITDQSTNVLIQSSSDMRRDIDELNADNVYPYPGNYSEQTFDRPASSYVVYGGSEAGDLIRIYHYGTIYRYPGGATYNSGLYGNSVITMPDNESQYLMACAAQGTDPLVWALVADDDGNAVKNVPITYAYSGSGALDYTNTVTSWSGIGMNKITGGSLGDTLTVSAAGLGDIVIYLSNTRTAETTDRVYGLYDAETHMAYGVVVQTDNNVMTDTFSQGNFLGYDELDQTSGNGIEASLNSYFNPQSDIKLCQANAGYGTIGAGDILRMRSTLTTPTYDIYMRAHADPDEFLFAFAMPGDQPDTEIWAIVTDKYGNAVQGKSIDFATTAGSLDFATGTTNYGGFLVNEMASTIAYGNTITVSCDGLPPVVIWPSPGENYWSSDKSIMWFDPTTLDLRNVTIEIDKNVMTNNQSLSSSNIIVYDNSANNRTIGRGNQFTQSGTSTPQRIGDAFLTFGTPGVGDIISANFGTNNDVEAYITIQRLNNLYLHAYGEGNDASQNIVAVVTDADGNALADYNVAFTALSGGGMEAPPPGGFKTSIDGNVRALYTSSTGYYEKIRVSTTDFNTTPIEIITYDQNDVQVYYKAIPHYNQYQQKVNVVYSHQYFNCAPDNAFSIESITAIDQTSNQKTIGVGAIEDQGENSPGIAYLSFGTHAQGDQVSINDTTAEGSPDALITLKENMPKYLFAYGTGGPVPTTITAIVVDENGNGLANESVTFTPDVAGTTSVGTALTGPDGTITTLLSAPGSLVTISAPASVSYTAVVQVAASAGVASNSRVYPWYSILTREAKAAIVSLANNILTASGVMTFTAEDATPNSRSFALGTTTQQSGDDPSAVSVINGSQGEGDIIVIGESTTTGNPDAALTISVPTSEIVSTLSVLPTQVSIGQNVTVTMSVFNNGSPDALSVSPTALAVTGDTTQLSGPTPGAWATIPGGESRDFSWVYQVISGASDVSFNGNAFGVDSFTMSGVTSTATNSNAVTVQSPSNLSCTLRADPYAEINREFDMTLTVRNVGQADALIVSPLNLTWTATNAASVSVVGNTSPATASISGGGSQDFTWTVTAGAGIGTLTFNAAAQGIDVNSGNTITAVATTSNAVNVIQGLLNLIQITSADNQVYQGQNNLSVAMEVQNTSVTPITITASALDFNGSQIGFTVNHDPTNPLVAPPQSNFTLRYTVDVLDTAPLGNVVMDGSIIWSGEGQNLSADGCATTASWTILKAFNALRQNYPNPLKLSEQEYTTFDYFVREDVDVTIKIYNLAGELVTNLYDGRPGVGQHEIRWYGDNGNPNERGKTVGSGVYIAVFRIGEYQEMKKVVVIR